MYKIKKTNIWAWDEKHTHLYFRKFHKIDGSTWSKNSSTWNMLRDRFDNAERDSQRSKLYIAEEVMSEYDCETAEAMTWNELIEKIAEIKVERKYDLTKPQGVRGRNSDNTLIKEKLGWEPSVGLQEGLEKTYEWIYQQIEEGKQDASLNYSQEAGV